MKKLPDRELLCYSYIAFRPWNHLERPQGYFVLFVGRRYYLRPNPPLERPPALGTRFSAWNRASGSP